MPCPLCSSYTVPCLSVNADSSIRSASRSFYHFPRPSNEGKKKKKRSKFVQSRQNPSLPILKSPRIRPKDPIFRSGSALFFWVFEGGGGGGRGGGLARKPMTADEEGKVGSSRDSSCGSCWTRDEDKAFENAIASWDEGDWDWDRDKDRDLSELWARIAGEVPGKSLEEIRCHYECLVDDVMLIESGRVEIPRYDVGSGVEGSSGGGEVGGGKEGGLGNGVGKEGKVSKSDHERRKGIAWTEEEHR